MNIFLSNTEERFARSKKTLLKIADNIMRNPTNQKYRVLQKSNEIIKRDIIDTPGALFYLQLLGFKETGNEYILAQDHDLHLMKTTRDEIANLQSSLQYEIMKRPTLPTYIQTYQNNFLSTLEYRFHLTQRYKDDQLLHKARTLIPLVTLEIKAQECLRKAQHCVKKAIPKRLNDLEEYTIQDFLLIELLDWFKRDFFTWVDSPACEKCGSTKTTFHAYSRSKDDLEWADRAELYKCQLCVSTITFHRFEDLNLLLETRRGRCGEWANAFTLLCCSLGWDARLVIDLEGDHVWTEVYSIGRMRWLHCDPSENVCDRPLLYETGWSKTIEYVIAYSVDEIQDVTWRYSANHKKTLSRRSLCSEQQLVDCLIDLRTKRQSNFSKARRDYLTKRLLNELVEFMSCDGRVANSSEHSNRVSGGLSWRQNRGEAQPDPLRFWLISSKCNEAIIKYSSSMDVYNYYEDNTVRKQASGWMSGVYRLSNMFRKEETDWKKVYLARREHTASGSILWRFVLDDNERAMESVEVVLDYSVFENGSVTMWITANDSPERWMITKHPFELVLPVNCQVFEVTATLSGGQGDCAWQHAQLFRQAADSTDVWSFIVRIKTVINKL